MISEKPHVSGFLCFIVTVKNAKDSDGLMEAIIFCGIQASGKSTFYLERFFKTHVRISLDLLRTRNRENRFLSLCLETGQRFVVDNTNPTRSDREKYIHLAREKKFSVAGYYFLCKAEAALMRNAGRQGKERVPDLAIKGTLGRLERPVPDEGYDALFYVSVQDNQFVISAWSDEKQ